MTIPTTIPTGGHPADREFTELQKAVLALLGGFSSDILKVANGGTNSGATLNNSRVMVSSAGSVVEMADGSNLQLLARVAGAPAYTTLPMLDANTAAGQTIANGSFVIVVFGTSVRDTDSAYNTGTGRWTCPTNKGGDYLISGSVAWSPAPGNFEFALSIHVGGSEIHRVSVVNPGNLQSQSISAVRNLTAGDIVDLRVFNGSAGNQTLRAFAPSCFFTIKGLGS
jgi:hypothetical protein